MFQAPLPVEYTRLDAEETATRIGRAKAALGDRLVILGHHYQRDEIIRWADYRGDSFKLSQLAAQGKGIKYIVFCGVHFMAESADVLAGEDVTVILPNLAAGCSMADMANIRQVQDAWCDLTEILGDEEIVPITYVNSAADLKAFVGFHGGSCCTSSNAKKVIQWAIGQVGSETGVPKSKIQNPKSERRLFFFPDQHLGRNTSIDLGFDPVADMALWNPHETLGGLSPEKIRSSRIILWKGHCSVHGRFTLDQIEKARAEHAGVNILVHPECTRDVVRASDFNGSTEFIIKKVSEAPAGSKWAIGTEINLVKRLQNEHPDKLVFCLDPVICPCSTMYRIHPHYLLWVLENLVNGVIVNEIKVKPDIRHWARISLERMLEIAQGGR